MTSHPIRRSAKARLSLVLGVSLAGLLAEGPVAQRRSAALPWGKQTAVISYDAVRVGEHRLSDLPAGKDWRMSGSTAATLETAYPLIADEGSVCVVPGSYRVSIYHSRQKQIGLLVNGATKIDKRKDDPFFPGDLSEGRPTKTLELDWKFLPDDPEKKVGRRGAKPEGIRQPAQLEVRFGVPRLNVRFEVLAADSHNLKPGFTLDMFRWPESYWQNRAKSGAVVAGTIRPRKVRGEEPRGWNLSLSDESAQLVPWMTAPTGSYGFGPIRAPDPEWTLDGEISWKDLPTTGDGTGGDSEESDNESAAEVEERRALQVLDIEQSKEGFTVNFQIGSRTGHAKFPWPGNK